MATRFLDDDARATFASTIETIENRSSIEVVVAVRRRSAGYLHANVIVGLAVAVAGLAAMLFANHEFSLQAILIDPFVVGLVAGAATNWLPDVQRWLTPVRMRDRCVLAAARATFVERGVHNTRDRSGVLVYIAWLEQRVVVVPDSGLPADKLAPAGGELTAAMRDGGVAVARKLETILTAIAPAMPRRADDVNELPDAVDSDLERPR